MSNITHDNKPTKMLPKNIYYVEDVSADESKWIVLKIKEKLCTIKSEFQKIVVFDSGKYGRVMVIDDSIQTSESDEYIYHEVMIHPPLIMHPNPSSILVIGGGDGGAIEEALKHITMKKVMQVELDKMVIEASRKYLPSINKGAFDDPRVELKLREGRSFLEETDQKFDVIVLDLTDPSDHSKMLYTREFYQLVTRKLTKGGIMSCHLSAWHPFPKITGCLFNTLKSVFPHVHVFSQLVPSYGMELAFCYASMDTDFKNFSQKDFQNNFNERLGNAKDLRWVDGEFLQTSACFVPKPLKEAYTSIDRVSTDQNPLSFGDLYPWVVDNDDDSDDNDEDGDN